MIDSTHGVNKKMDVKKRVMVVLGKLHDYLAMLLNVSVDGVLKVHLKYYVDAMIKYFPCELKSKALDNGLRNY